MIQNLFSIRQFQLTKLCFLVHRTTRNAPYIYTRAILRRTFSNAKAGVKLHLFFTEYLIEKLIVFSYVPWYKKNVRVLEQAQ